eukprot:SAG22_NODE_1_length_62449_cov_158.689270_21_plen_493_part_00
MKCIPCDPDHADEWHGCSADAAAGIDGIDGCQRCRGNAFTQQGTHPGQHGQNILFSCIQFSSTHCSYDATTNGGDFDAALRQFAICAGMEQPEGYCHGALTSAAQLRNGDVCTNGANSDIGFHIRIPFVINEAGMYQFRMHADYGNGAFIGIDGAEHTPGNTWGHLMLTQDGSDQIQLTVGNHEFEALGFEDCCDGHAELEVHLPCDTANVDTAWRTVVAGASRCLNCNDERKLDAQYKFIGGEVDGLSTPEYGGTNHGTLHGFTNGFVSAPGHADQPAESVLFSGSEWITVVTPFSASDADFTIAVWLRPDVLGDQSWHGFVGKQDHGTRMPSMWVNNALYDHPTTSRCRCSAAQQEAGECPCAGLHWDTRTTCAGSIQADGSCDGSAAEGTRTAGVVPDMFTGRGVWKHVIWTKIGTSMKFYNGGRQARHEPANLPTAHVDTWDLYDIGRVDNYFTGAIDQVSFFNYGGRCCCCEPRLLRFARSCCMPRV